MVDIFQLTIPELTEDEERTAYVYVPDAFLSNPEERYPVLYMFDGHNLFFDSTATFGKSWGLKEYLDRTKRPLIIASVACNMHPETYRLGGRLSEYSPFSFSFPLFGDIKGRGKITMDWLTKTFKPYIDAHYPTRPERKYTFIGGSSMGGLMTLYALACYNDVFSRGAALSTAAFVAPEALKEMIRSADFPRDTVLYMDYGEKDMPENSVDRNFYEIVSLLLEKQVLLESRIVPGGLHSESSWEKQVPFMMDALFYEL